MRVFFVDGNTVCGHRIRLLTDAQLLNHTDLRTAVGLFGVFLVILLGGLDWVLTFGSDLRMTL